MPTSSVIRRQLFINGEWRDAAEGKTIEVINPATEDVIAEVASAEQTDVDAAVAAARAAFDWPWSKLSARERGRRGAAPPYSAGRPVGPRGGRSLGRRSRWRRACRRVC